MLDRPAKNPYSKNMHMPEQLVIRPPSEAASLLVRVVRGCDWNRCRFCGIYDLYGVPFSRREVSDVKRDIDALKDLHGDRFRTAFLGDANPLVLPADFLCEVLIHLRTAFPSLRRVTAYGRASSLWKKTAEELERIREAGLDRIHTGMESGSSAVLALHRKGTHQAQLIEAGAKAKAVGFELSYYMLLGLGGRELQEEHVQGSITVLSAVKPDFIRIRRLWIHPLSPLRELMASGEFRAQEPEGTLVELRELVRGLDSEGSLLVCDHANNYLQLSGTLNRDRASMLKSIEDFLAQPDEVRQRHYQRVGDVI